MGVAPGPAATPQKYAPCVGCGASAASGWLTIGGVAACGTCAAAANPGVALAACQTGGCLEMVEFKNINCAAHGGVASRLMAPGASAQPTCCAKSTATIGGVTVCNACAISANPAAFVCICRASFCRELVDGHAGTYCTTHGGRGSTLVLPGAAAAAPGSPGAATPPAPVAAASAATAVSAMATSPGNKSTKRRAAAQQVTRYQVKILPSGAWAGVIDGSIHAVTSSQAIRFSTEPDAERWGADARQRHGALRGREFVVEPVLVREDA